MNRLRGEHLECLILLIKNNLDDPVKLSALLSHMQEFRKIAERVFNKTEPRNKISFEEKIRKE